MKQGEKHRATIVINKKVWELSAHFLPAGLNRTKVCEQALVSLIMANMKGLADIIQRERESRPGIANDYEHWILGVGLWELYCDERAKLLGGNSVSDTSTLGISYDTPPPFRPVLPPYADYHKFLRRKESLEKERDREAFRSVGMTSEEAYAPSEGELLLPGDSFDDTVVDDGDEAKLEEPGFSGLNADEE